MRPIIKVENLSKQYRIGAAQGSQYATLRETINEVARAPLKLAGRWKPGGDRSGARRLIWALREVSFDVYPGEALGIIGQNGSGKSTLLKTLSLITEPTLGCVELYGRFGSLLEVGTGFHPELTGRENIYLNGAILGMKRGEIRRHFDEIVAFAEVEPFIDTPVKRYSSGMYLRLAFAVAAHLRTEILLIDEVLAVGDAEFQKKCLGKVEGVAREGRTVLFVSHNIGAITEMCGRALWLNEGRLEADGNARQVVSAYFAKSYGGSHKWERAATPQPETIVGESKRATLRSAQICQEGQSAVGAVSFDKEFTAEIEYEVTAAAVSDMSVLLRVVTETGTIIFSSRDTDATHEWKGNVRPRGVYVSACRIPGNLLRSGKFFLTVGIFGHGGWIELFENVLMFEVSPVGNPFAVGRKGVITPVLDWNIHRLK